MVACLWLYSWVKLVWRGNLAALFLAPDIHSKVMLYVDNSRLHLFTLLLAFFPFRNLAKGFVVISDNDVCSLEIVIPLCYGIINSKGFLFSSAPFLLSLRESVRQKCYGKLSSIVVL